MNKNAIIARVQAGDNVAPHELLFVPLTEEQRQARNTSFIAGLKQNMFKLIARARFKGA